MQDCKRILKFLASSIAETIWPTRCVGCDEPQTLLCNSCRKSLPYIDSRLACSHCGAPFGKFNCTECHTDVCDDEGAGEDANAELPFACVRAAVSYEELGKKLVTCYKDKDERRLSSLIAGLMADAARGKISGRADAPACFGEEAPVDLTSWANAVTYIPASPEAIRKRGFDHMELVAQSFCEQVGLPLAQLLSQTKSTRDQRELTSKERSENRKGSFSLARPSAELPARILLLDDVFTTGATTVAATQALLAGGVTEVAVTVCARVW